jgi:hypothetical protein
VLEKNGGDDGTRTRGLCRDSLWFRCNSVKIYGADRHFWRPKEPLVSLIAPLLHPDLTATMNDQDDPIQ